MKVSTGHHESRQDIQVLRGIAVLQVVLYHAGLTYIPGGYLGVDVFFVVSGFLVTRMILDRVDLGHFSFKEFYLRRAKRLLPASACTLLVTTLLATQVLSTLEFAEFLKQLLGAMTFSANVVLWKQSGYFDEIAATKPLLHIWSLSLEEQYYFLLPLLLAFLPSKRRGIALAALSVSSLCLCLLAVGIRPAATFFLLPTRAWELLIGSLCAVALLRDRPAVPAPLLYLSLAVLLLVPVITPDPIHPRFDALLICAATACLLLGRLRLLEAGPLAQGLTCIGDWSYSLYLVHWPLLVFVSSSYMGDVVPPFIKVVVVVGAIALAFLQYRFVESPFRNTDTAARPFALAIVGIFVATLLIAYGHLFLERRITGNADFVAIRKVNFGMNRECSFVGEFRELSTCMTSTEPQIAVWGDSFAMHLMPGLLASSVGDSLVQMTKSSCGPVLNLAIIQPHGEQSTEGAATGCADFNRSVLAYLAVKKSITIVVMSSPFDYMFDLRGRYLLGNAFVAVNEETLLDQYAKTVAALRSLGKKVVIVAPPPSLDFNIGLCSEKLHTGKTMFGRNSCEFDESAYLVRKSRVVSFLGKLERAADVTVLWPRDVLCQGGVCASMIDGKFLYRDGGHLSRDGSIAFEQRFALAEKVMRLAR